MSKSKGSWWSNRHRKYKYQDKRDGLEYDLTLDQAKALMSLPCFYCTVPECRGLDRLDNKFGHTLSNVVPCCGKCNLILGSVPYVAKLEMRESLRNIREKKLIDDWTPPYLCEPKPVERSVAAAPPSSMSSVDIERIVTDAVLDEVYKEIDREILECWKSDTYQFGDFPVSKCNCGLENCQCERIRAENYNYYNEEK